MNVRGTKELMDLAKGMGNLESFVHVSTCYSHCHLRDEVIQEKIYPPESLSVKEVLEMSQSEFYQTIPSIRTTPRIFYR